MRVLQSPITWIVVAAVLLVLALVLIIVSGVRRRRRAAAAAWPPPALESGRPDPDAVWTGPPADAEPSDARPAAAEPVVAEPTTNPLDVEAVRATLAAEKEPAAPLLRPSTTSGPVAAAEGHRPRHPALDSEGGDNTDRDSEGDARAPTEAPTSASPARPSGDAAESAKDRLLAVLLRDPSAAVAALAAADRGDGAGPGEEDVTALLRAGLSPTHVARLVGVDEDRLATVVARGLGLLPGDQDSGAGVSMGENRTEDPGRSWANAASSAGSTTPTTG